jgi:hypothetical protein
MRNRRLPAQPHLAINALDHRHGNQVRPELRPARFEHAAAVPVKTRLIHSFAFAPRLYVQARVLLATGCGFFKTDEFVCTPLQAWIFSR